MSILKNISDKIITFFMLVTPNDALIADYAVKSYLKIYNTKNKWGGDNFILYIYANGFKQEHKDKYFSIWKIFPYVYIFDNEEKIKGCDLKFAIYR